MNGCNWVLREVLTPSDTLRERTRSTRMRFCCFKSRRTAMETERSTQNGLAAACCLDMHGHTVLHSVVAMLCRRKFIPDNGNPRSAAVRGSASSSSRWFRHSMRHGTTSIPSISMMPAKARFATTPVANNSCTTNGVMNAVEIDVGNLKRWLAGNHRHQRHECGLRRAEWIRAVFLRPPGHAAQSERRSAERSGH